MGSIDGVDCTRRIVIMPVVDWSRQLDLGVHGFGYMRRYVDLRSFIAHIIALLYIEHL